jgi:hypothetical protein
MNNQGGWMATRRQIVEWHRERCLPAGFLPPYPAGRGEADRPMVSAWNQWNTGRGDCKLPVSSRACNLQRILTLEPNGFSRHLLYHTSNNKQRQPNVKHRFSSSSINQFWGQLNTVRKNAEKAMQLEMEMELENKTSVDSV